MTYYKIRINCTSQKDLTINNKKINCISYNNLENKPDNIDYISKISILYEDNFHSKSDVNYINKTLEFYCNRKISEIEFKEFINNLKNTGFNSKKKEPKIQLIEMRVRLYLIIIIIQLNHFQIIKLNQFIDSKIYILVIKGFHSGFNEIRLIRYNSLAIFKQ